MFIASAPGEMVFKSLYHDASKWLRTTALKLFKTFVFGFFAKLCHIVVYDEVDDRQCFSTFLCSRHLVRLKKIWRHHYLAKMTIRGAPLVV